MSMYSLSVIIPAYNCSSTISQTIDSVLSQKSKDLEIIIVNDGSSDSTEEICLEYVQKYDNVKYFKKSNSGVSDTRNVGIDNSRGKYIAFLDSDDVWHSDYYDESVNEQLKNGEYEIFAFSSCFSDMDLNILETVNVKNQELVGKKDAAVDIFYHSFCSFIFKSDFIKNNSLYFNNTLRYGEDELFRSQCLYLADRILAQDKLSFYYRNNINSATKLHRNQKLYAIQKLQAYRLMKKFFFEQYEKEGKEKAVGNSTTAKYLIEAIKLLSETGYGYRRIRELCENEEVKKMYEDRGKRYRLYHLHENTLEKIAKSPFSFYAICRFRGLWRNTAVSVKHALMKLVVRR
ncbi:MAG: glycosyltransferase family 2 protein [Clostridia bacterium]|nr:glycosyltransferase family 2 protein [Clostridia bacterium]